MFEIRDRMTFIPVLATKLDTSDAPESEAYLVSRAGFGRHSPEVLVTRLGDGEVETNYEPGQWECGRTMGMAHVHIKRLFDVLEPGAVIDVEYILGETDSPKKPEGSK